MSYYRILLAEPDPSLSRQIASLLKKQGHHVIGTARDPDTARRLYEQQEPDLVLLDLHLGQRHGGIDFARYLRRMERRVPFIFTAHRPDEIGIALAKQTLPAGFLAKPLQPPSLFATIEIVLHRVEQPRGPRQELALTNSNGGVCRVAVRDIYCLKADHIYVVFFLIGGETITVRGALTKWLDQLPADRFVRTHRSYVINLDWVTQWDKDQVRVRDTTVPLSRYRRQDLFDRLRSQSGRA